MTTKIIVAIVAIAAAVLSLAAPVAVEAQPVELACSDADSATWRFSAVSRVYDFAVQSDLPADKVSLRVVQYIGSPRAWTTRLSLSGDNLNSNATGTARLQGSAWTEVRVRCDGEGDVTLTVTSRAPVRLVPRYGTGSDGAGSAVLQVVCEDVGYQYANAGPSRLYISTSRQQSGPFDAVIRAHHDTWARVALGGSRYRSEDPRGIVNGGFGSRHVSGYVLMGFEDPGADRSNRSVLYPSFGCSPRPGSGDSTATLEVTRREPVSLRRQR